MIPGAPVQKDGRFAAIVKSALANEPMPVVKNDGTQFIRAGDLANVYLRVLQSGMVRKTRCALSAW